RESLSRFFEASRTNRCSCRLAFRENRSLDIGILGPSRRSVRMKRLALFAGLVIGVVAPATQAQPPIFQWKSGQVLSYRVAQSMTAVETVKDSEPMITTTQLDLVKRWQVTEVDSQG